MERLAPIKVCLLGLLAAVLPGGRAASGMSKPWPHKAPWFCHGLDCPHYTVTKTTDDYELRAYDAGKWASTTIEGYGYSQAVKKGFMKLFNYIGGKNEAGDKIAMTAPVRVLVHPSEGPFCESNFTVSFYVPFKFQDAPPTPKDESVFIEEAAAFEAYVVSYGGWQSESKFTSHASKLIATLHDEGEAVDTDEYYAAGYDSPFRLMDRHNEVWLIKSVDGGGGSTSGAGRSGAQIRDLSESR